MVRLYVPFHYIPRGVLEYQQSAMRGTSIHLQYLIHRIYYWAFHGGAIRAPDFLPRMFTVKLRSVPGALSCSIYPHCLPLFLLSTMIAPKAKRRTAPPMAPLTTAPSGGLFFSIPVVSGGSPVIVVCVSVAEVYGWENSSPTPYGEGIIHSLLLAHPRSQIARPAFINPPVMSILCDPRV